MGERLGAEVNVSEKNRTGLSDVIKEEVVVISDKAADINGGLIIRNGDIEYNYSFGSIISIEKEEIQQIAAKILYE